MIDLGVSELGSKVDLAAIDFSPGNGGCAFGSGGATEKAKHATTLALATNAEKFERLKNNLQTMVTDLQNIDA